MSKIRGKNTKPEIQLRKALWSEGIRYRLNYKLTGRPDLCFPGKKVAVFVDGCFWHCCPLHAVMPKNNKEFWHKKLKGNIERDLRNTSFLVQNGWVVLRFWEHEIKDNLDSVVTRVKEALKIETGGGII